MCQLQARASSLSAGASWAANCDFKAKRPPRTQASPIGADLREQMLRRHQRRFPGGGSGQEGKRVSLTSERVLGHSGVVGGSHEAVCVWGETGRTAR